jgi:diaminopimelate epimerase
MRRWSFTKGHGTENDFVVLLDRDDILDLTPAVVRFLCDRRAGIGGDGVLRAVFSRHVTDLAGSTAEADDAVWFMDYRNADGSVAQMCGNGVRVFARFLLDQGLATGPVIPIATRAGVRTATIRPDGQIRVDMGLVRLGRDLVSVRTPDGQEFAAVPADVGNPHAVSFCTDLARLSLHTAPTYDPAAFPQGVNLEFVQRVGAGHLAMRVFERGSGETRSCGTGVVAVAAVARSTEASPTSGPAVYRVDVPGGVLTVELDGAHAQLSGPAVLVAHGEVAIPQEVFEEIASARLGARETLGAR